MSIRKVVKIFLGLGLVGSSLGYLFILIGDLFTSLKGLLPYVGVTAYLVMFGYPVFRMFNFSEKR